MRGPIEASVTGPHKQTGTANIKGQNLRVDQRAQAGSSYHIHGGHVQGQAADTGDYIAFILPASFAKITQIRQIPEHFHLIYQEDLLEETFRFERSNVYRKTILDI